MISILLVASCGGGGGGGDGGDIISRPPPTGWVTIDSPDTTSTICNEVSLTGAAFISPTFFGCCNGSAEEITGVTVTWRNETNGQAGKAIQTVSVSGLTGPFNHRWTATVPVAMGTNTIIVSASDPAGINGTASVDISKTGPSFKVSGQLRSVNGIGLGFFESGISVTLAGAKDLTAVPDSGAKAGAYSLSCVPPGTYTLTPKSSAFHYDFSPSSQTFDVVDHDVTLVDMVAPAYRVDGRITFSVNGAPSPGTSVMISSGGASLSNLTDNTGLYLFVVPDGPYRIEPHDLFFSTVFTPASQDIIVSGQDISALNFAR
ncbi:hypothetical protein [Cupriavidus numazuensis]|nr:hypothetical protein [Cupriavidus numazuensis]